MKKIISVILSVTMLCIALYVPLTVGAANLSTGEKPTFDMDYVAVFNDFEDASLEGLESDQTRDDINIFTVVDTGETNYNHSFKVAAVTWAAISDGKFTKMDGTRATYTDVKGNTVNLFDESLTVGKNYIMSYDYKNISANAGGKTNVSISPTHTNFHNGSDYRDTMEYHDNTNWYKHIVGFTADKNSVLLKINSTNGVGVYVDNLLIVEAAELKNLAGNSATIEIVEGEFVTNNKNGVEKMVAKGNKFSFKVNVSNAFYQPVVTHGGEPVTAVDGVYTIDKVTSDIEIKTEIMSSVLEELISTTYNVDTLNNITFSAGDTLAKFMDETKIVESMISLKNGDETVRRDEVLKDGYVLSIISESGETILSYTVKVNGTVTDYTPKSDKIDVIDTYISDTIVKSGTVIDSTNLEKSLLNDGNRSAVANVIKKAMDGEDVTIVTFGGSITAGAASSTQPSSITHTFEDTKCYSQLMEDWFKSVFGDNVTVKNAGIGATDTPYAIHRMNMDVMAFNPDMVIVEWDKNDVNKDTYKQATYENMLRKFISKGVAVVMLGLCGKNTGGDDSSIEMHIPLAEKYDLPYISYRDAFGEATNSYKSDLLLSLSEDGVHPNIVGHHLVALLLNNYFGNIYKAITSIGLYEPIVPKEPYNEEAILFGEGKVVDLDDAADGKVDGVEIVSLGSFEKDSTLYKPGTADICDNHARYAYKAKYSESYEPMVIKIDNCYSLHLLLLRVNRTDGKFRVFVDDNEVTDPKGSFTSGTASDNTQIEHSYAWASSSAYLNNEPVNITLKILPTNEDPESYVGLYGLLLADKPDIDYSDGKAKVTAPDALELLTQGIVEGTGTSQGKQTTAIYLFAKYDAPMYAGGKTANPNKIILDNGGVATVVSRTFYVMSKSNYDKLENKDDFGKVDTIKGVQKVTSTGQQLSKYWRKSVISGTNNAETTFGVCIKNITAERKDTAFAVRAKIEYRIGDGEVQTVYSNIQTADYFSAQGAYDMLESNGQQPALWFNTHYEDGGTNAGDFFG